MAKPNPLEITKNTQDVFLAESGVSYLKAQRIGDQVYFESYYAERVGLTAEDAGRLADWLRTENQD